MPASRFNLKYISILIGLASCTFVISMFLMQLLFAIIFILWLTEKNSQKRKAFDLFTLAIIIFGIIRIFAALFSQHPEESNQIYYREALFYASFVSLQFYFKAISKSQLSTVIKYFIAGGVLSSLSGILMFNLHMVLRAQSFSSGYTVFSAYLLAVLPVILFLPKNILNEKIRVASLIIILIGIVTSLGRTPLFIAALFVVLSLILRRITILNFLIVVIAAGFLSYISFENNKKEVTSRMSNPSTLSDRDIIWKGASELMFEHPIMGFGPRTFQKIFPYRDQFSDKGIGGWHNDIMQTYFESGILGLLALLIIIILIFIKGITSFKDKESCRLGVFLSMTGLILSALTAGLITSAVLSIVFVFLLTIFSSYIYSIKTT